MAAEVGRAWGPPIVCADAGRLRRRGRRSRRRQRRRSGSRPIGARTHTLRSSEHRRRTGPEPGTDVRSGRSVTRCMRAGRLARLGVVPALAGIILVATAAPAWAHAVLKRRDPPDDGVAAESPAQLSLTFNENVEVSFGAIRVYTCAGTRITTGAPRHATTSDRTVELSVPKLDPGVYLVAWRVISADSHPVGGTYSFRIGPGGPPSVNGCATETNAKSSATVGDAFGVARGGRVRRARAPDRRRRVPRRSSPAARARPRRTRRVIWAGWIILTISTVAARDAARPVRGRVRASATPSSGRSCTTSCRRDSATSPRSAWCCSSPRSRCSPFSGASARTRRCGERHDPRGGGRGRDRRDRARRRRPGSSGTPATGDFTIFAVPFDTLHVLAMSVWLGGLVVLAARRARRRLQRRAPARAHRRSLASRSGASWC